MNNHSPADPELGSRQPNWAVHSGTLSWLALHLAVLTLVLQAALLLSVGTRIAETVWLRPLAQAVLVGFVVVGISAILLWKSPTQSSESQ